VDFAAWVRCAGLSRHREQVQTTIPPHAILLEFLGYRHYLGQLKFEDRYGVAVIPPSGRPKWVPLGACNRYRDEHPQLSECRRGASGKPDLAELLRLLYDQVWAPLASAMPGDTTTVVLSPDAALNFLSFATLVTPDNQFLGQKYSVRYIASGRDLLREVQTNCAPEMAIFVNPSYSTNRLAPAERGPGAYLAALPGAEKEGVELQSQVKSWRWPTILYQGGDATEARLRALRSPRILHLATHGFFLPRVIGHFPPSSFAEAITPEPERCFSASSNAREFDASKRGRPGWRPGYAGCLEPWRNSANGG